MRAKVKPVLVTGGGGLIGSALRMICPDAAMVTSRDYDLTERSEAGRMFREHRPERVIHLAAVVGGVKKNADSNADLFTQNILINTNVLEAAQTAGVKRLIGALSSCAFQTYPDRPSTEADLHLGLPFQGNLGYGISKRMLDLGAKLFSSQYGVRYGTITPVTVYGPHDNWDLESGHVVGSLIHKCFLAKRDHKPFRVWGSGRAVRQFIHSGDVAGILLRALDLLDSPDTIIVAPDRGVTIKELAEKIAQAFDFTGEIVFDAAKPEGQLVRVLESRTFSKKFGDFKFTPLAKGLKETVEWFCHSEAVLKCHAEAKPKHL